MKKLLLASIITFGICSFAGAQSVTNKDRKDEAKKNGNAPTSVVSTTPQKSVAVAATTSDATGVVVDAQAPATTDRTDAEKAKKMEQVRLAQGKKN